MDGFLLKRKHADGGNRHYLSLFSGQENHESIVLPFSKNSYVDGSGCGGLLYFDNFKGRIIISNPTTKTFKSLDPPKMPNPPNITIFSGSGLGYDRISDDYKVVRLFTHCPAIFSPRDFHNKAEVFSLKRGSWKEINSHVDGCTGFTNSMSGIYINGVCYWSANGYTIISFDFADERFSSFDLPVSNLYDHRNNLIKVNDMLGVFRQQKPLQFSTGFELLVRKEGSWVPWCNVHLCDIVRPLLLNEGQFLFLEKQLNLRHSQLVVYDLKAEKLEELDIYDYPKLMTIIPYVEDRFLLRCAKPMEDGCYSKDEEKEEDRDKLLEWRKKNEEDKEEDQELIRPKC
ncbi:F-box/kelch-repeat protein At3g23880-like [Salvia miltiorrhiza]|uniref:F-box/kelch-repeat protein At3g23880-like n=1 Tax=Salvia miltiorrhiza TaxID=226208 RepID=UPI0025AD1721|nr:F-box/kelch-repeat protein At3g23880-like [Salvia miltiorrhiza]